MNSPLHHAVTWCNYDAVKLLLDNGADINKMSAGILNTPLHLATGRSVIISKLLIERGADIMAKNKRGVMPLVFAVKRRIYDLIPLLATPDTINNKSACGQVVLQVAYDNNDMDCVNMLIQLGAHTIDKPPLITKWIMDVQASKHLDKTHIRTMLNSNTDPKIMCAYAIKMSNIITVDDIQSLIDKGVDINMDTDRSLLMSMCLNGNIDAVDLLLRNEAIVCSASMFCAVFRNNIDILKLLISHGGRLDHTYNADKISLLHSAVHRGHIDAMRVLIENGVDINAHNNNRNNTPIMEAIKERNITATRLLIEAGADLTIKNKDGHTSLQYARWIGNKEIYELVKAYYPDDN
jgi:ankyrin repeat protein